MIESGSTPKGEYLDEMRCPRAVAELLSREYRKRSRGLLAETPSQRLRRVITGDISPRKRIERQLKKEYYYGGLDIAVMDTARGPLVVASGPSEEVAAVLDELSSEVLKRIRIEFPQEFLRQPVFWMPGVGFVRLPE